MVNDPTVLKFLRAAKQRLTSAEVLLHSSMELDSTYLAGYSVECALKALLLGRSPRKSWAALRKEDFAGKGGHNFERLKERLKRRGVHFTKELVRHLRTVSTWSTELRYEVGRIRHEDAERFVQAAKEIVKWVEQTL